MDKKQSITLSLLYAAKMKTIRENMWKYNKDKSDYIPYSMVNNSTWMTFSSFIKLRGVVEPRGDTSSFRTLQHSKYHVFRYMVAKIYIDFPKFRSGIFMRRHPTTNLDQIFIRSDLAVTIRLAVNPSQDVNRFFSKMDPLRVDEESIDRKDMSTIFEQVNAITMSLPLQRQADVLGLANVFEKKVNVRDTDVRDEQKGLIMKNTDVPELIAKGFMDEYIMFLVKSKGISLKDSINQASKEKLMDLLKHQPRIADWDKVVEYIVDKKQEDE